MTDRRSFLTAALIAPVVMAAPAIASVSATQHPDWLALLADFRKADDAHSLAFNAHDEAQGRYYEEAPAKPRKVFLCATGIDAQGNALVDAAAYNAELAAAQLEFKQAREAAHHASGWDETEEAQLVALNARIDAANAIIAYPSRDPEIIASKLRFLIEEYGDDNDDLGPLLVSIVGEVQA